ncbi:MAG: hypothetical protein KKA19_00525 [Candidatus Margulisbacteria bacterium]|nr:hypothetical protein [Candidatus Margulisiibacteriota bacterium]
MTYIIKFSKQPKLYIVTTQDKMTAFDFIKMAEDLLNDPNYVAGSNGVFDHRNLIIDDVPYEDLTKIRNFHMKNGNRIGAGRCAMIVKSVLAWNE